MASTSALVGSWELCSYSWQRDDGTVEHPFGPAPRGLLVYTADGRMTAQLFQPAREALGPPGPRRAPEASVRAALGGYVAYYGRWEFDPEEGLVRHHVEGSLIPDWIGGVQERRVALAGDELSLSTPPFRAGGKNVVAVLAWKRARARSR